MCLSKSFLLNFPTLMCPILQALISSIPLFQVNISLAVTGNLAHLPLPVSQTQPLTGLQAESASADSIDRLPCLWSRAHRLYEALVPERKRGLVDGALCCYDSEHHTLRWGRWDYCTSLLFGLSLFFYVSLNSTLVERLDVL